MPQLTSCHRVRRAYTLIELLIVVGVLGLAASLLVPHLANHDSMKVQAAVRLLIADLSFAQSDALAHQEYRRVHFYEDGSGYCLLRVNAGDYADAFSLLLDPDYINDPLATSGELGRYIVNFGPNSRFETVVFTSVNIDTGGEGMGNGGDDIVYDALGGTIRGGDLPGAGGVIVITSGPDSYQINISPFTGKLSVTEL
jgi:prepilin-type N-terminal cleavage/methylation domain-containing protein